MLLAAKLPKISVFFQTFRGHRENNFKEAKNSAIKSEKWGGQTKFQEKRMRKVKRHFDELCENERLANSESFFKVNVFYRCLNIINAQLTNRFQSLQAVADKFSVIQPNTLISASDEDLYKAEKLANHFNKDISPVFPGQLLSFRSCLKSEISKQSSVKDLANILIVDNNALASSFSEFCTVLLLFLTIPVTVASAEHSFSKIKLIKNYLRSTMGQERLRGLGMLSIENERARKINLQQIIDEFTERKARKMRFK
uniref:HAT C-terminal dimerisation domain-containing protein n=1 Tax=Latimeria chalumnae TaxID=7897 RepID=H2ZY62_LATCH